MGSSPEFYLPPHSRTLNTAGVLAGQGTTTLGLAEVSVTARCARTSPHGICINL